MKVIKKIGLISLSAAPLLATGIIVTSCSKEEDKTNEASKNQVIDQNKKQIDSLTSNTLNYENKKASLEIDIKQEWFSANTLKLMGITSSLGFDLTDVMAGNIKDKEYTTKMHNDSYKVIKDLEPIQSVLNLKEVTELKDAKITIAMDGLNTTTTITIGDYSLEYKINLPQKPSEVIDQNKKQIDSLTSNTLNYENKKASLEINIQQEWFSANTLKLMGITSSLGFELNDVMEGKITDKEYTAKMHNDSYKVIKDLEPIQSVLNLKEVTELKDAKITIVLDQKTFGTTTTITIGDYSLEYKINLPSFS